MSVNVNGGGDGGQGAGAAGGQAGGTGAAPTAGAQGGQAGGQSTPPEWTSGLNDDLKGFVKNKGFGSPADVLDSYRNFEKLMGAPKERLIKIPENMDDSAAMGEIYGRLGRPEKPENYQLPVPEGAGKEFSGWASGEFHKLGLSTAQGRALAESWNNKIAADQKAFLEQANAEADRQVSAVKTKWGAAYEQNEKIAKAGALQFGVDGDTLDKIEKVLGYQKTMEFFHAVGSKVGDDKFIDGGNNRAPGILTPGEAEAKIKELQGDPEFVKKYNAGGVAERTKIESLQKMALGMTG